ncbi:dipeptidyl-peptidase 7. Serine peptidase. MEROPS family S46 [Lishizhenia tianjinensis]|uniref:Dipeptidyl-peptidase n=1 Tax=Lishizhenia tianjinensis TaxID=477690 RepID=A0A1I6XBC6_9FLAO|nr:S46 family peptidase [Lishizhenia tianjinensis]SFT35615.1 dipeptidyl-peptidase 7. Serine peptidase. MEROPS family S46 [Lishizhenia tianjinensis]
MRLKLFALASFLFCLNVAKADEGMWLPFLLGRNYEDMKKHGLNLTQEEIYSINNSSIKDAIVSFGGFCTAEVISTQGLLLTNHHCGYDAIAGASTPEHNYLDDGFWAKEKSQEIPVPGLFANFVVRIADVSEEVNKNLSESMTLEDRQAKIKEVTALLTKEATEGTHYEAFVRDFFEGNEFYLFVTEKYNDVRLVGTPPQSIGKFGYDTDNWVWPRHTGDFSMFRIYAGKDNAPAKYNAENIPFTPRHSLPVSIKGVQEGDYAMILGFPGSTDRYLSSYGIEQAVNLEQPKRVDVRAKKLEIMKKHMDQDTKVRLKYSSKYAQVANYWKYFIGQTEQLKNNKVADKKRAIEAQFNEFTASKDLYQGVMTDIKDAYATTNDIINIKVYQSEFIYSVDLNLNVFRYTFLKKAHEAGQTETVESYKARLAELMNDFYANANMDIEFEILEEVLKMYNQDVPAAQQPELVQKLGSKNAISKYIAKIKKKSVFANQENFNAFMEKFSMKKLMKDPLYVLIESINAAYAETTGTEEIQTAEEKLERANRLFVKGIREMMPEKKFYPNANSTLRLTYGNVLPYSPADAVTYHYTTSLSGVMQKEDPNNPEFVVPAKLKTLWENKDFGQYGNEDGTLTVNFLTNNDITGGNSGSPVINADGQLIGTAFDGNWEAMSGDIYFEPEIQRTIVCDIRYVLFVIEKYGEATNLIEEMNIIK